MGNLSGAPNGQQGAGSNPSLFGTGSLYPARAPQPMPSSPGGKPGGPGGQMGPQQPGGKPGGPGGQMGSQMGGQMMRQAPQSGFPPPTGKPGMPPVNPQGLAGQRTQMGNGLLNLQGQPGVLDQANVNLGAAPSAMQPGQRVFGGYGMPY